METHNRSANALADTLSPTTVSLRRRRVFVHQSVVDWIHDPRSDRQLTQRARLVLWQMFAQGTPTQIKSVRGAGRGWLRSDLGGNHGHQFYLWWSRAGSIPLEAIAMERGDVLVRDVRHHDGTDEALEPGTRADWLPLDAADLDGFDLSPALLPAQQAALTPKGSARMIRGQPGTGKTTVLARAALLGDATSVLYLTYSDRLAVRAREYFREFAPQTATVRVSTFRELFRALGDAWTPGDPRLDDDDHARELRHLEEALSTFAHRYAPWEGKSEALHAELHAYFAGASLPEAFRDSPACPAEGFTVEGYVSLRKAAIGEKAATVAAKVGRFLAERDALRVIAPGPWQARRLLDALRTDVAMPASLADVRSIFVDEVQDLTRVEAALLVDVADAIGRAHGAPVELVVAGDEGQTVRATDFEWGALADLIARRFSAPQSFDLASNVRSPSALVSVVNSTWDLYQRLAKDRRPRGRATVDIEESVSGRVIRCRVRDDAELSRLARAFSELPRAAFVHAGTRAPDGYLVGDVETFGSATAKGLDFSVVAVIGAGRHIADAHAHLAQGATEAFHTAFARTMIDQLRVAVSRASDTLVFVDREGDAGEAEVDRLVRGPDGGHAEGFVGEMSVDDLISLLDRSDATAEELVNEFLFDVRGALDERTRWALERARRARGLLGRSDSKVGVSDLTLRAEAMRLHGVAALRLAVSDDATKGERRELFVEANRALHAAKHGDAGMAALWIRDLREKPTESGVFARRLLDVLPSLDESVPEWRRCARDELARWCRQCASRPLPDGGRAVTEFVESVETIAALLDGEVGSLAIDVERLRVRAAEALYDVKKPGDALKILARVTTPLPLLEARCHEARLDFTRAMEMYEDAGAADDALRCARSAPDLRRALALAERIDARELDTLRRLGDVTGALERIVPDAASLNDAEFAQLKRAFERVASARKPGRAKGQ